MPIPDSIVSFNLTWAARYSLAFPALQPHVSSLPSCPIVPTHTQTPLAFQCLLRALTSKCLRILFPLSSTLSIPYINTPTPNSPAYSSSSFRCKFTCTAPPPYFSTSSLIPSLSLSKHPHPSTRHSTCSSNCCLTSPSPPPDQVCGFRSHR